MAILFLLIPVSLVLVAFGCWAFFWAARTGQFEELDRASWDILTDEEPLASKHETEPTP